MNKVICIFFIGLLSGTGSGFGDTQESELRKQLVYRAYAYLGTPYVYGGISGNGVDCSGFVYRVYQDVARKKLPRVVPRLYENGREVDDANIKPGDLVFFDTTGGVSHVGIYVGNQTFIHAASEGRVIGVKESKLTQAYYKSRYVGARTYFGEPGSGAAVAVSEGSAGDRPHAPSGASMRSDLYSPFVGYFSTPRGRMIITRIDGYGNVQGVFAMEGREGKLWGKIDTETNILAAKWVLPGDYGKGGASGEVRFSLSRNPGMLDGIWRRNGESRWHEDWDALKR